MAVLTGVSFPQLANASESNNKIGESGNGGDLRDEQPTRPIAHVLSIPLRSLPVSGCWAATITVSQNLESDDDNDFFTYLAVVDTGSPFLTAPMGALSKTQDILVTTLAKNKMKRIRQHVSNSAETEMNVSYEQYGTTIGSVQWRKASYVTLIGGGNTENIQTTSKTEIEPIVIQDQTDVVLGIPSDEVVAETGGIFLGLMTVDAARPTPLQQFGYDAFAMRFRDNESPKDKNRRIPKTKKSTTSDPQATLVLWSGKQNDATNENRAIVPPSLIDRFDPYSMKLFDLTPYGPNLHHYGVLCERFECWWDGNEEFNALSFNCDVDGDSNSCTSTQETGITLSRPLVAVFDTGLSGCIFSDTLWEEIQRERRRLKQYGKKIKRGGVNSMEGLDHTNEANSEELPPVGCTVCLPTIGGTQISSSVRHLTQSHSLPPSVVKLSGASNYWLFQSFRLPWWYDDKDMTENNGSKARSSNYPHVVVLGSAFWRNPNILELAVDTTSERAKIKTVG